MRVLKLIARVAFICNICFLVASLILWLPRPPEGQVVSTVIVMGFLMGMPLNIIVFGFAVARRWRVGIPIWVLTFNAVVFCLQLTSLILRLK